MMEEGARVDGVFLVEVQDNYANSMSKKVVTPVKVWEEELPAGTTFDSAFRFILHRQNLLRDAMLKMANQPACDGLRVCSSGWPKDYLEEAKAEGKSLMKCLACLAAEEVKEILHGE